jgi:hypothetical protein
VLRLRSIGPRVLLGWLATEWFGVLLAYGFALVTLTFLITYLYVLYPPMDPLIIVPVWIAAALGLYLVTVAAKIPRELLARALQRSPAPLPTAAVPPAVPVVVPPPAPVAWSVGPLVERIAHVGVMARGAPSARPLGPEAGPEREAIPVLPGWMSGFRTGAFAPEGRVPAVPEERASPGSIRVVDLAGGPLPPASRRPPPTP